MSVRTTSNIAQRQSLLDLQRTSERLAMNESRIATGKRITKPGDDPTAAALILDFGNSIQANIQYIKQADSALSFLTASEDAVASAIDANMRLQELAQQGLNSTAAGTTSAIVAELDGIRANMISLANTKDQGKYLFAGTNTQTAPFSDPALPNPPLIPPTWNGNSGVISLDVSASTSVATNIPGDQVFLGAGGVPGPPSSNFFQAISNLRAELLIPNNAVGIQAAAKDLSTSFDFLSKVRTDLGGRQASLNSLKDMLSNANLNLQDMQNTQQDTDYPAAMTEYTSDTTVQSVTLSAMAKASKTTLFDYLG
jgi:flagellar hook-associated protein 3 FlgL